MYYKIPPVFAESLGLTETLIKFPDGNYLASRAVMARIDPDIDAALQKTGGIMLTPEQARDDQMGIAHYPLPAEDEKEETTAPPEETTDTAAETTDPGLPATYGGQPTTEN